MRLKTKKTYCLVVLLLVLCFQNDARGRVASISFDSLVDKADILVVAKVLRVSGVDGHQVAYARVVELWKGKVEAQEIRFLAEGTWTCDTSSATEGEEALLFLVKPDAVSALPFPGRQKLVTFTDDHDVFFIAHSGRGRLPIFKSQGQKWVSEPSDIMDLPEGMKTLESETEECEDQKLMLSDLKEYVLRD